MSVTQQEKKTDPGVVSSHGYVVDNSQEYIAPKSDPAADAVDAAAAAAAGKTSEAGPAATATADPSTADPSTADPSAGAATDDKTAASQQAAGPDLNAVLQEIMGLKQSLNNPQAMQQQQMADPIAEIDQAINVLEQQVKEGEITSEEFTLKSIPLIEQRVQVNMERKLQQDAQAKNVSDAQGAFIAQNPDFVSFAQSPEAAALINSNPVLDNVSAYYMAKHKQAEAKSQALQAELDALKATQAEAIKNAGKTQAKIVGADMGTDAGVDKLYRGDGLSPQQGGIAALRRARAQQ